MSSADQLSSYEIAERLHGNSIHLLRRLRREDENGALSAPRLSALSVVVFGGPITLGELAAAEQVRPPTMTRIVGALEQQGLIVRRENALDRRSIELSATSAGKRLLLQARRRRIGRLARTIDDLPDGERELLAKACDVLARVIQGV